MTVDWAIIATSAAQQADGSLAIIGAGSHTFLSVPRASLPQEVQNTMPPTAVGSPVQMCIVARINANRTEINLPHKIDIRVVDADGAPVVSSALPLMIPNDPNTPAGWPLIANVVMNFGLGVYPSYGEYAADIIIDGDSKKLLRFRIVQLAGGGQPMPQ